MALAGGQPLGRSARRFLLLHHLWLLGANLSGTFVNAFLFRARGELAPVAVYNLALYAVIPLGSALGGYLVSRSNRLAVWRWGVAVNGAFYVLMLLAGERAAARPFLVGAVAGLAAGLYWLAFSVISYDKTEPANRGWFFGLQGALTAAVNTLAPLAAGLLIARLDAGTGYSVVFGISLAVFAGALVVSLPMQAGREQRPFRWGALLPGPGAPAVWRRLLWAHAVVGLREGIHWFLPLVLLFAATRSEALLGRLAFWVGVFGAAGAYVAGKLAQRHAFATLAAGAAGLAAVPALLAVAGLRPPVLFGYAVVVALLAQLFYVPWSAVALDLIGRAPWASARRLECLVAREVALGAGRVTTIGGFLLATGPVPAPGRLVLILAVTALAALGGAALVWAAMGAQLAGGPPPAPWHPPPLPPDERLR